MTFTAARLLLGAELRTVVRDTAGLVIPIALPMLILVSNSFAMPPDAIARYLLPTVLIIVVATIGVINTPSFLATYRKAGVLRRLAVTPLQPLAVLGSQVVAGLIQIFLGSLLACLVAMLAFDVPMPAAPALTLLILVLSAVALFAVGMVVAAVAPTSNSALAIGLITFFGMSSIGGMFGPVDALPDGVERVGEMLPFGASVSAVVAAWNGDPMPVAGVVALVVTTVVCTLAAVRWFRWT